MKTYKVQTWNPDGSLKDHYSVELENEAGLRHLRKFLKSISAHVAITPLPKKPPKATAKKK